MTDPLPDPEPFTKGDPVPDEVSDLYDALLVADYATHVHSLSWEEADGTHRTMPLVLLELSGLYGEDPTMVRCLINAESWDHLHFVGNRAILRHCSNNELAVADAATTTVHPMGWYDADALWDVFARTVSMALGVLEPEQFLILETAGHRFVQIAVHDDGARAETVSNQYLAPDDRLPMDDLDRLAELGWEPPTYFADDEADHADGSPNHFVDLDEGWDPDEVAEFLCDTLRAVHAVVTPFGLTYAAGSFESGMILLPTLGLPRTS